MLLLEDEDEEDDEDEEWSGLLYKNSPSLSSRPLFLPRIPVSSSIVCTSSHKMTPKCVECFSSSFFFSFSVLLGCVVRGRGEGQSPWKVVELDVLEKVFWRNKLVVRSVTPQEKRTPRGRAAPFSFV